MLERLSKSAKITLSILFCLIGAILISYTYFDTIKNNLYNEKNIEYLEQQIVLLEPLEEIIEPTTTTTSVVSGVTTTTKTTKKTTVSYNYIGYLEVPKVKIKRGFVDLNSKYNSVKYNVMLIKGSEMPDVQNGNLILAAHNGNSSVSFFNDLYKLSRKDKAYITYKGKKYTYELVTSYEEKKDGKLTIKRNAKVNTLTLITCTKGSNTKQTVFIFELIDVD